MLQVKIRNPKGRAKPKATKRYLPVKQVQSQQKFRDQNQLYQREKGKERHPSGNLTKQR